MPHRLVVLPASCLLLHDRPHHITSYHHHRRPCLRCSHCNIRAGAHTFTTSNHRCMDNGHKHFVYHPAVIAKINLDRAACCSFSWHLLSLSPPVVKHPVALYCIPMLSMCLFGLQEYILVCQKRAKNNSFSKVFSQGGQILDDKFASQANDIDQNGKPEWWNKKK